MNPPHESPDFKIGAGMMSITTASSPGLFIAIIFILTVYAFSFKTSASARLPIINPPRFLDFGNRRRLQEFTENSLEILKKGRDTYPDQPYLVFSPFGAQTVMLPTSLIDEVKSHPALGFSEGAEDQVHAYIPGFKPFRSAGMGVVLNRYLTKSLGKLTKPLSTETTLALRETLPDCSETTEINLAPYAHKIVSRVATRAFAGEELCRNQEWIRVSAEYTRLTFGELHSTLHEYHRAVRPLVHWFMPKAWKARRLLNEAHQILAPYLEKREALRASDKTPPDDALEWVRHVPNPEAWDPTTFQISLALNAIHTTTDLLLTTMVQIAKHPELFQALREEVIHAFTTHGLQKTALADMRLLDSVTKESQRLKPPMLGGFRRWAVQDFKLSSGHTIRRGQAVTADTLHMMAGYGTDYENPLEFDPYRFLKMRSEPSKKHQAELVSTSSKHLGFGHGNHACPGRFFAANEIKVILAHMLLKYDWELAPGSKDPQPSFHGFLIIGDQSTKFLLKRRQEEINLNELE